MEVDRALLHSIGGSNVITFWSRDIDKYLYLQLSVIERPQGVPHHPVVIDF